MLILRWGGANWRGLRWLVRNRNRWISVWGSFGFYRAVAYAALRAIEITFHRVLGFLFPRWLGFLFLGWPGDEGSLALPEIIERLLERMLKRMHLLSTTSEIWLNVTLAALLDAAAYCCIAAIAWWAFEWKTHKASMRHGWEPLEGYCAAFLLSVELMGIANNVYSWRPQTLFDADWPYGFPFTYYHSNGWGYAGFVWKGLIGDVLVILLLGAIVGWVWNKFCREHRSDQLLKNL
jgi:hypothetical protein